MNELTELLETKMQSFLKDAALQVQNGNKAAGLRAAVPLWKYNLC